jgi:integrase
MRYRLAPSSVRETANKLSILLQWCADPRMHNGQVFDPLKLAECDIDRYATQMEQGLWSSDGKPLAGSTIGGRQHAAISFLRWAKCRGYDLEAVFRESQHVVTAPTPSGGMHTITRKRYAVVRRSSPSQVTLPTRSDVKLAISAIPDAAVQVGAKLVFFAGLRASEVCTLTLQNVFHEKNQRLGNTYFVRVLGKGKKWRSVEVDLDLLHEMADFKDFERKIRLHQRGQKSDFFLINETTGRPFEYRTFWKRFRETCGISPHFGRHWYAVNYLTKAWEQEQAGASSKGLMLALDHIPTRLSGTLILLKENLGHTSLVTTERYLVMFRHFINGAGVSLTYQEMLDSADVALGEDDDRARHS